jgi:hypothetical protein
MFEDLESFVTAWSSDENFRRCTHAARGVFVSVFCLVVRQGQGGVLVAGDTPWSLDEVAAVIGGNADVTLGSIDELLAKRVLFKRPDGALFIAELVEREEARKRSRERVQKHRCNGHESKTVTTGDIRGITGKEIGLEGIEEGSGERKREEGKREGKASAIAAVMLLPIPQKLDSPVFRAKWAMWVQSRITNHKTPKLPTPMFQEQLDKLMAYAPEQAIAIISQAVAGNYQGLVWPDKRIGHSPATNHREERVQREFQEQQITMKELR